jgi:ribosomal protein S18 acetylase RimI-like enzyme
MIQFTTLETHEETLQLLDLQQQNLEKNISSNTAQMQGFVTVVHNVELLTEMNQAARQVIAKDGNKVIGYAIVMLESFRLKVPVLSPMFDMIDNLEWQGKSLRNTPYYVMGQICVAESHRGQGVFDGLYQKHKELMASQFDVVITEVAIRNTRSMAAHSRVGFETIHEFEDLKINEIWAIIAWDLKS